MKNSLQFLPLFLTNIFIGAFIDLKKYKVDSNLETKPPDPYSLLLS